MKDYTINNVLNVYKSRCKGFSRLIFAHIMRVSVPVSLNIVYQFVISFLTSTIQSKIMLFFSLRSLFTFASPFFAIQIHFNFLFSLLILVKAVKIAQAYNKLDLLHAVIFWVSSRIVGKFYSNVKLYTTMYMNITVFPVRRYSMHRAY